MPLRIAVILVLALGLAGGMGCRRDIPPVNKDKIEKELPAKVQANGKEGSVQGLPELDNDTFGKLAAEIAKYDVLDLELQGTKVNANGIKYLRGLKNLKSLNLSGLPLNDVDSLSHLADASKLVSLNLENTGLTDGGLPPLANVKSLKNLVLDKNAGITGKGMASLAGLTELRNLSLEQTKVDDDGILQLKGLTKLAKLRLKGVAGVTDTAIAKLMEALPDLDVKR